ncbi:MAG: hypothetical protein QG652_1649 [Pseudomonadota bacterium]|nr:hypothetical protein [Pseudomonadota bacterium]
MAASLFFSTCALAGNEGLQYEYKIKAAYLYNFTKFTKWPLQPASESAPAELNICILGQDPFGDAMDILKGKSTAGVPLVVKNISRTPRQDECQVLFISKSEKLQLPQVLQAVAEYPVLTIGDMDGFAMAGGCIELVTVNRKVIFNINLQATQRAQLKMSAQLLELAKVVID